MEKEQIKHNEKILKRTQIIQQQLIPLPCSNIKQTGILKSFINYNNFFK